MKPISITPNLKKLASILSDTEYHSGTDIGNDLGCTRSSIWKMIKQLSALGMEIESVTNRGYRLSEAVEFLEKSNIKKNLSSRHLNLLSDILIFDELPSTNDFLMANAMRYPGENIACFSEMQTAGRGRLGRQWISPFARNIYMSLLWHFDSNIAELAGLNIVIGVSIAESIKTAAMAADIKLKWPNDIIWQDKKLGGVLIDIIGEYNGKCRAVIGIGINMHMPKVQAEKITKSWTDLLTVSGKKISRNTFSSILLEKLITNIQLFQESRFPDFIQRWQAIDYLNGKDTVVKSMTQTFKGKAVGINHQGNLLLKIKDGSTITITTGDASIQSIS